MIKRLLFGFVLLLALSCLSWNSSYKYELIDQFSTHAIHEMHHYGIPASIKIAQAIIETSWGKSPLVQNANNYFGIKCKETWDGPTFMHPDDDRDAKGKLIPSCFRSYEDMVASFRDHSIFLSTRKYYKELFTYPLEDYIMWANGLKKCGYATDPKYAQKLILLIEQYDLAIYDKVKP